MKKRTFYVINLDRNRIFVLSLLMAGFLLITFATGLHLGKDKRTSRSLAVLDRPIPSVLPGTKTEPTENTEKKEPSQQNQNQTDVGHSKYSIQNGQNNKPKTREPSSLDRMVTRQTQAERKKQALIKKKQSNTRAAAKPRNPKPTRKAKAHTRRKQTRTTRAPVRKRTSRPRSKPAPRRTQDKRTALLNGRKKARSFKNTGYSRGVPNPGGETTPKRTSTRVYSLQVGSYSSKSGAHNVAARLKKQGFYPYVSRAGRHYKVSVGRNSNRRQLLGLDRRLRTKKYRPILVSYKKRKR